MRTFGAYRYLSKWPIWGTSAILLSFLAVIPLGRSVLDGFLYNVSFSSMVGDPIGLVSAVLIVATVLQRGPVYIPRCMEKFLQNNWAHLMFAVVSFLVGVILHLSTASHGVTLMDTYHDIFIMPLFIYFGIILIPIMCFNGTKKEKLLFLGCIILWSVLFIVDINNNLMNQHVWLYSHTYLVKK